MLVLQAFDKATSPDEHSQLEFVKTIPTILGSFGGDWVKTRLIPFLVSWFPTNNLTVVSSFLEVFPSVIDSSGSLLASASLFEVLLAADVSSTATDRKSTRLNSSHLNVSRMPSSA
jgi:hypothetical protein